MLLSTVRRSASPAILATLLFSLSFVRAGAEGYGSAPASTDGAITSWPTGRKLVALTFDDGPNAKVTPALMDLLEARKVPATFYLLGQSVQANPKLTAELASRGFELGNHSYSHPQLTRVSAAAAERELTRTADLIKTSAGANARIPTMRPPYGAQNARVRSLCAKMDYPVVLWDVDTNDWRKGASADKLVKTVLDETRDGSIILMHDRYPFTVEATRRIIDDLRARGYEFVTVSALLAQPRVSGKKLAATTPKPDAASVPQQVTLPSVKAAPSAPMTTHFPPPAPVR